MHLLDSSAWMAHFFGEKRAKEVQRIIDSDELILLSAVNLVEIYSKYVLRSPLDAEEKKNFLLSRCRFADVTKEIALEASRLKAKHTLAIADSIILATARIHHATVLTFDPDFTGLQGVRVLKKG